MALRRFLLNILVANRVIGSWIGDSQATPLNPNALSKSTCNLSPALLSRISFNDR